jgi:hypothetical protein
LLVLLKQDAILLPCLGELSEGLRGLKLETVYTAKVMLFSVSLITCPVLLIKVLEFLV